MVRFDTEPSSAHPLGITTYPNDVNVSVFSQAATEVSPLLFDSATAVDPMQTVRFDPFQEAPLGGDRCTVQGRSIVVLECGG